MKISSKSSLRLLIATTLLTSAAAQDLVVHYRLDEQAGTTVLDSAANGFDGTLSGGFTLGQPAAGPATGTSLELDGISGLAAITDGPPLTTLRDDFTILAWVKVDVLGPWQRIFSNNPAWGFGFVNDQLLFTTFGILDYVSGIAMTPGVWVHVAATLDTTGGVTFYVDGLNASYVVGSSPSNPPSPNWWIGSKTGGGEFFDGWIDDIQVYAGALTDEEVGFLYDNPGVTLLNASSYCIATVNSTGQAATLHATGSSSIGANTLSLLAAPVPDELGVFFYGPGPNQIPFGNGFLCVSPPFGRLTMSTNTNGEMTASVNLAAPPSAATAITAGSTWYFQAWFQDSAAGGAGLNLSNGVEVAFIP